MVKNHPFDNAMLDLFGKLEAALKQRQEADIQITTNTAAIRGLANACEDEDYKGECLVRLDELTGKPGFKSVILTMLTKHADGLTPNAIAGGIRVLKLMDLSNYSNPSASIHTTLRRMEGKEVEKFVDKNGEKAYRLTRGQKAMREALKRTHRALYGE
jgi:hypothetical protein